MAARTLNNPGSEEGRESMYRTERSRREGRITDRAPDFIGAFKQPIDGRVGIFELFIKTRDGALISGEIEDVFGTALFTGSIPYLNV